MGGSPSYVCAMPMTPYGCPALALPAGVDDPFVTPDTQVVLVPLGQDLARRIVERWECLLHWKCQDPQVQTVTFHAPRVFRFGRDMMPASPVAVDEAVRRALGAGDVPYTVEPGDVLRDVLLHDAVGVVEMDAAASGLLEEIVAQPGMGMLDSKSVVFQQGRKPFSWPDAAVPAPISRVLWADLFWAEDEQVPERFRRLAQVDGKAALGVAQDGLGLSGQDVVRRVDWLLTPRAISPLLEDSEPHVRREAQRLVRALGGAERVGQRRR